MVVLVCVTAVRHPIKSASRGKGFFWLMTQVSIHGHMVLLFLDHGEADHSDGKYGWIVAREGADQEPGRRKERPGTSCTLPGHVPPTTTRPIPLLNSISSMSESLQDTS